MGFLIQILEGLNVNNVLIHSGSITSSFFIYISFMRFKEKQIKTFYSFCCLLCRFVFSLIPMCLFEKWQNSPNETIYGVLALLSIYFTGFIIFYVFGKMENLRLMIKRKWNLSEEKTKAIFLLFIVLATYFMAYIISNFHNIVIDFVVLCSLIKIILLIVVVIVILFFLYKNKNTFFISFVNDLVFAFPIGFFFFEQVVNNKENVLMYQISFFLCLVIYFMERKMVSLNFKKSFISAISVMPFLNIILFQFIDKMEAVFYLSGIASLIISLIVNTIRINFPSIDMIINKTENFDKHGKIEIVINEKTTLKLNQIKYSQYDGFSYYDKKNKKHYLSLTEIKNSKFKTKHIFIDKISNSFKELELRNTNI